MTKPDAYAACGILLARDNIHSLCFYDEQWYEVPPAISELWCFEISPRWKPYKITDFEWLPLLTVERWNEIKLDIEKKGKKLPEYDDF